MTLKVKEIYSFNKKNKLKLPLFISSIKAGFPSPADDYIEKNLDLNEYLIKHPPATFFLKVEGESMIDAGIRSGDILIVDRSLEPKNNKIVIAALNGELTVKRIKKIKNKLFLVPENNQYLPIEITNEMDFSVWGIVTYVIHPAD
jgi:DNA polymerase V